LQIYKISFPFKQTLWFETCVLNNQEGINKRADLQYFVVLIPNKEGYLGKQRRKKDLFRQLIVVVPRAPGMHSGRGVAAVLSNCSSICCSGMWTETTRCSEFVVLSI